MPRPSCIAVPAVTGTGMASLASRHGCEGMEKVRGKAMHVGKVLEEDGEDQEAVHVLDKGTHQCGGTGMLGLPRRLGLAQRSQSWFVCN